MLLQFPGCKPAPPVGTLRWGDFLPDEKVTKESPKAGPFPALWNPPRRYGVASASFSSRPWAWQGHIDGIGIRLNVPASLMNGYFYRQGLTLGSSCSQLPGAWLPAVGTPLLQGRPGRGNYPAIGPVAKNAWCGGSTRSHSKGNGPNMGSTHVQPGTPGRFLGGNALSGLWFLSGSRKKPPAGSVPTRLASLIPVPREGRTFKWKGRRPKGAKTPLQPPAAVVYWERTQPAAPGQIPAAQGGTRPVLTRRAPPDGKDDR